LVEFASVVDAMRCAIDWQGSMAEQHAGEPADGRFEIRIARNLDDHMLEGLRKAGWSE
jgi:hypothetical protein